MTSAGYALGTLAFYTALAAISEGINRMIFGHGHSLFNPFNSDVMRSVVD